MHLAFLTTLVIFQNPPMPLCEAGAAFLLSPLGKSVMDRGF
jgi:hypothetical protein